MTRRDFPIILPAPCCLWVVWFRCIMPKMKTKKAAAKRFRITGKGRVRRSKAGGNHGMQEKSRKRLRRLRNNDMVHPSMEKHVKRLLPYG